MPERHEAGTSHCRGVVPPSGQIGARAAKSPAPPRVKDQMLSIQPDWRVACATAQASDAWRG